MLLAANDTITAQATPPGRGGVGIIRVSGPLVKTIADALVKVHLKPRYAHYGPFWSTAGEQLDQGLALFFPGPHSFTGEDVLELQAHGGPVIIDLLLREVIQLGARLAKPGEFSERAFLNDKLDLAQAEAIADLIDSSSEQAARCALRSLQGAFSTKIHDLVEQLIQLRIYVEAAIDFPEEEIDFLSDGKVEQDLNNILTQTLSVQAEARQGSLLREGMYVVIAGRPNAGKSSLLNALAGREAAIVTAIEGTTRDVLKEHIHIDGMPLHIIDTAGLRDAPDEVEQIGIARAWEEIKRADRVLLMVDSQTTTSNDPHEIWPDFIDQLPQTSKITVIRNKADLSNESIQLTEQNSHTVISLSAKSQSGIDLLRQHLKDCMGFSSTTEGGFMARRRHLDALDRAQALLETGLAQLQSHAAGELLAEDLRQAQQSLNEITGEFSPDDLLGRIFSSFCIGK
ncbi:tRNA uridine-5-carboxymethylaminomethyl(34) synthesis GTPase MnmE [Neptuniibacter sp. CAU 1671]|uniref:tRNA uridine-5-carboxymethylaminomethyl(34) synthesis GTPase MnmE n=1 Tax=Neptuniibacter sp. CAU 1671 TaxID=3032593 RepID=UPI0023DA4A84|nr:tRNA uridine-5-carboxymethylaminomethyl(34) synthesis GTPase MnmE [Neptuniibacter sp. CAU 1671]MDF2182546.1 tRNA uridine-5-carboxymethylaminomethyl(34) synthesis GTPase MnmE [Neptuniibacter sp. CAU 1671]